MHGLRRIFLLTYMVAVAVPVSLAFNVDVTNPDVYVGKQKDFFGYKVLQFMSSTDKGIIITAPLQLNGTGGICKPDRNQKIQCFNPEDISSRTTTITVKNFGLSMAEDYTRSEFTVCSPNVVHECDENSYVNSLCYNITNSLQNISSFRPAFQECTEKQVDLVFLFDGSLSMTEREFNMNKVFIEDIMNSLKNSSIKFAAVQFSTDYRKVFDFSDYEAGRDRDKLMNEPHMKSLTNTHKALTFVLDEILENPDVGATPDATKVVVLITDGDPTDFDRKGIVKKYDDKNIIRFVIGVKKADLSKFRAIASEPKDKNVFKIEDYNGLTGILENFQKKIFEMEGSKVSRAGEMTDELSQSGFTAIFYKDHFILGSVGSNNWRGSLQDRHQKKETQIEDPQMQMDSYMGYSISVGEKNNAALYFTGAPRFEHIGQVILFRHNGENWTAAQRINGEQIGSYFGATVCSVDVNSDGDTDFLLVGAPLFYQAQEKKEGQLYIYTVTDKLQLRSELEVIAPSMGRFGMTISSLGDLNGDGLREVAVGAPLEDYGNGAVYIYLGDGQTGIRRTFSQRIMGENIKPGLRFFGQSIDGHIDLGEDGLTDIVVGSEGTVVVLRSKPVFDVMARLTFLPKEISTDKIDCLGKTDQTIPMVTLRACFEMVERTKSNAGAMSSGLNISYNLCVDPMRQNNRGFFSRTDKKAKTLTSTYTLRDKDTCFNYTIYMPTCVKDLLSPMIIKFNFSQVDSESASAILNVDSKMQAVVEVPFEKHCRKNDACIAELEVDFNFMSETLLVARDNYFNVSVKLSNHGDDSYYTSLTMHYPPGLYFSKMDQIEETRAVIHSCEDLPGVLDKTVCGIGGPLFRSRSDAKFITYFRITDEYEWNETISMTISGKSDNTNPNRTAVLSKSIPVKFQIKMAVIAKDDHVTYLNFTTEDAGPKEMFATYKIENLGFKDFPVNVSIFFPTKLDHKFEMMNYQVFVQPNKTQCTSITDTKSENCSPEKDCKIIVCDNFILEKESPIEFTLSGDVQFRDIKQQADNIPFFKRHTGDSMGVKFKSFIDVDYDKQRYVLDSYKQEEKSDDATVKWNEVQVELIILPNPWMIIAIGVALGFLILVIIAVILLKSGFFKRKTVEDFQAQEEKAALQPGTPTESMSAPNNWKISQSEPEDKPSEEKILLDTE